MKRLTPESLPLPPERIILDLSVPEFAALALLANHAFNGAGLHRDNLERGLRVVRGSLRTDNKEILDALIANDNSSRAIESIEQRLQDAFGTNPFGTG